MGDLLQPTSDQIRDIIGLPETLIKLGPVHSIIETSSVLDLGPTADVMLSLDDTADKIFARKDFDVLGNVVQFKERALPANPPANEGKLYVRDLATVTTLFFLDSAGTETNLLLGGGASQTPWLSDIDADGFDLNDLSNILFRNSTGPPLATDRSIHYNDVEGMVFNALTGDFFQFEINAVQEYRFTATQADFNSNNVVNMGTLNTHTIPGGTSTFALISNNLSVFAATTSLQLLGVISDETGTGLLVFGTSPTIVTPTIASFANATHSHLNAAGGGTITKAAISDTPWAKADLPATTVYTDQANTFGAFAQRFPTTQLQLDNPAQTFQYVFATSAIITADKTVTLPLLTASDIFVFEAFGATLTNKTMTAAANTFSGFAIGAEVTGASTALTDTADIAYLNTPNSYIAGNRQDFLGLLAGTSGLNVGGIAGNPTTQVDGDIWYNSTANTMFGRVNGANVDLGGAGASLPVVDTTSIAEGSVDATKEVRFEVDGNTTGIIGVIATIFTTAKTVTLPDATDTLMGKATTDVMTNKSYDLGGTGNVLTGSVAEFNTALQADTFAFISDNLSVFAATTSLQFIGVISDETGTGLLVFNDTPTILTPTIASFANATHDHQAAAGGGTLLSTSALSDTADIAYLNQANTFGAFLNTFAASTLRIPVSATPTIAVNGDIGIDTTITDFITPLIRYFGTESMVVVAVPDAQIITPTGGHVITYNATNDEFELVAQTGGSDTPWTVDHDADGFDLNDLSNLEFRDPSVSVSGPTINAIYVEAAGMVFNTVTGNTFAWSINDVDEMTLSATILNLQGNTLDNVLDITNITSLNGVAIGNYILTTDNISQLATATKAQYDANLSDDDFAYIGQANVFTQNQEIERTGAVPTYTLDRPEVVADDTDIGIINFTGFDDASAAETYAIITGIMEKDEAAISDGSILFECLINNVLEEFMQINDAGGNVVDFFKNVRIKRTGSVPLFRLDRPEVLADDTNIGAFDFAAFDDAGALEVYGDVIVIMEDDAAANPHGSMRFRVDEAGTLTPFIHLNDASNGLIDFLKNTSYHDNVKALFGTGDDASITFNATLLLVEVSGENAHQMQNIGTEINNVFGAANQLATTATDGFVYISESNGPPTGVPTAYTGKLPIHIDSLNSDFYIYDGGWVNISPAGGSDTPWTEDHDAANFDLRNLSNLEFTDPTIGAPAATVNAIYVEAAGMVHNVPTGNNFAFSVNDVDSLTINNALVKSIVNMELERTGAVVSLLLDRPEVLADGTTLTRFDFTGFDDASAPETYARISVTMADDTAANPDGTLRFIVDEAGTLTAYLELNASSGADIDILKPVNMNSNNITALPGTFISALTTVTALSGDFIMISDTSDSGNLKKVNTSDFLGGASQTPWTSNIDAADFSLSNLDKLEFNNNVDTPVITQAEIYFNTTTTGMNFNVPTGDEFTYRINGTIEMTVNITELDLLTLNIVGAGTLNTHTIPGGTSTFAVTGDNLSVFAATTSLQFIGVISDETGAGLLVFNDTPTIITPTIASFVNATHTHANAAGGGQLTNSALTAGVFAAITGLGTQSQNLVMGTNSITGINDLEFTDDVTLPASTVTYLSKGTVNLFLNVPTGDIFDFTVNAVSQMTINVSTIDFQGNTLTDILDITSITSLNGVAIGNYLLTTDQPFAIDGTAVSRTVSGGSLVLDANALEFNTATESISIQTGDMILDVTTGNTFSFDIATAPEYVFDSTQLDILANNIIGIGILQFTLDTGHQILDTAALIRFAVSSGDTFEWTIGGTIEMTLSGTVLNLPTATFQENSIDISPIGTQDIILDAGAFKSKTTSGVASGQLDTRELPTNDNDIDFFRFTNGGGIQRIMGQFTLPRNFNNTNISIRITWTTPDGTTGDVAWKVRLLPRSNDDPLDAALLGEVEITDTFIAIDDVHIADLTALTLSGAADADFYYIQIERDPADAQDTLDGDADLLSCVLQVTTDAATSS